MHGCADFSSLGLRDRPTNLSVQLTTFVGREGECREVERLLVRTRLLTLTGPGGVGKTRLALEVAAGLADEYADGVWLVELASLADPTLVPQTIAATLGMAEVPGQPFVEALAGSLRSRQLLLVLDNCEHLAAACADLAARLLRGCPGLRVLATSREPLGVPGETVWPVPPLGVPDPRVVSGTDEIAGAGAVRLFIDRARSALPSFAFGDRNAAAVAEICRRLDGIPLAIELAAARVSVLAPEQILERLDDRFQLLTGGSRTAPSRQQTLRATLDWSHQLLTEPERVLFRRLAVFVGGWDLEAAEAVCAGGGIADGEVLDLLDCLVSKSLVVVDAQGEAARYRLLESIRAYGQQRLLESGEAEETQRRHVNCFLKLAEEAEPALWGLGQTTWFERLEREHDNLRAALRWSLGSGDVDTTVCLGGMLGYYWLMRGHRREGQWWLEQALAANPGVSISTRARAVAWLVRLADNRSDHRGVAAAYEEGLTLLSQLRQLGHRPEMAILLEELGRVALRRGDYVGAGALVQESLGLWRELGDKRGVATALCTSGRVATAQGDHDTAEALYLESLTVRRELGDRHLIAHVLFYLGIDATYRGHEDPARALQEESLTLSRELGCKEGVADSSHQLARLWARRGDHEQAIVLCAESLALYEDLDARSSLSECLATLAGILAEARPEDAARLLGAAEGSRESVGSHLTPAERTHHDRVVAAVRSKLPEPSFVAAWAGGQAMTLQEAIQYARNTAHVEPGGGRLGDRTGPPTPGRLTPREREVAALVARGLSNRQIGEALVIAEGTANLHVKHILAKLGFASRAQIAAWAVQEQLVPPAAVPDRH